MVFPPFSRPRVLPVVSHANVTSLLLQILGKDQDAAVVQREEPGPVQRRNVAAAAQAVVEIGIHHLRMGFING